MKKSINTLKISFFKNFIFTSMQLGNDFLLTQGSGGITSFKGGDHLYIKDSGLKLKDVGRENIFAKVNFKKNFENIYFKKYRLLINNSK